MRSRREIWQGQRARALSAFAAVAFAVACTDASQDEPLPPPQQPCLVEPPPATTALHREAPLPPPSGCGFMVSEVKLARAGYSVTLSSDGHARFAGEGNIKARERLDRPVSAEAARKLACDLKDDGFYTLKEAYGSCGDGRTVITTLTIDGETHEVARGLCATTDPWPEWLPAFEDRIDSLAHTNEPVRRGPRPRRRR